MGPGAPCFSGNTWRLSARTRACCYLVRSSEGRRRSASSGPIPRTRGSITFPECSSLSVRTVRSIRGAHPLRLGDLVTPDEGREPPIILLTGKSGIGKTVEQLALAHQVRNPLARELNSRAGN